MGSSLEFGLSKKNWLPTNRLSQMTFSYRDNPILRRFAVLDKCSHISKGLKFDNPW